ncbi:MAG: PEP-CTERM sorting domain-containing protein [Chthoniobacteraceae bacterium]|nr:PEP-CTERM sorting domain-containing protein [Chthoniobacteraceae bacterium]
MKKSSFFALLVAAASLLLVAGSSMAADLSLTYSGNFGPTSSLAGVAFGVDTAYTFTAVFDPSIDQMASQPGVGMFSISHFTIDIQGHGTYTGDSAAPLCVLIETAPDACAFGLAMGEFAFLGLFGPAGPSFSADAPTAVTLSDYQSPLFSRLYMPLADGAGELRIEDVGSEPATAQIDAVPEPSAWMMVCLGFPALLGAVRLRRKAA